MNKKIFLLLFLIFFTLPAFSKTIENNSLKNETVQTIEAGITFDWISKTQLQRDENINKIQKVLFTDSFKQKYTRKEFNSTYSDFLREKNYMNLYEEILNGKKEDESRYYCGFYAGKLLIAYGIQYKNDMKNIYYYDAMGHLRWIDVFSENYPKFPYWAYQYYKNGNMTAAYYYVTDYDQYVFDSNKNFKGRWYKDKLYNRKAKVIMTRTSW